MAKTLQHRRDTTANLASVSGAIGEFFMDTTKNTLVVMDGSTNGGHPLQLELTSGTTIKTINGTSLLGSGDIVINPYSNGDVDLHLNFDPTTTGDGYLLSYDATAAAYAWVAPASGGAADFSAVAEDVLPAIDSVYDLGSSTKQWYDLFVSNSVTIDGGSLTGNATGLVTDTMLIGDLLLTTNTITPNASTATLYNGEQGVVEILGNLDVSTGDWMLAPTVETVSGTPPLTTGTEGAVRYNKDNAALELYTDSWNNLSAAGYTNSDVDTHLNTSTASSSQVLSWNGSDYAWVAQSSGGSSGMTADIIATYSTTTQGDYTDVSGYKQVKITGHFGDGVTPTGPYLQLRNNPGSNTGATVGTGWGKWWRNTGSSYSSSVYTPDLGSYIYMGMNGGALDGIFEVEFTIDETNNTLYIETKTISSASNLPQQGFRGYYTQNVSGPKYFYFESNTCYNVVIRGYN